MSSPSPARTVPELFLRRVALSPERDAFRYPAAGDWKTLSWRQAGERVREISCGLRAIGLQPEQRCAILSGTRMDWILADLGILCAGGATTTIYPSNTPDECAYILKDSQTAVLFAENDEQVQKIVQKRAELPSLKKVITFDGKAGHDGWVLTFSELAELGRKEHAKDPAAFERVANAVRSDSLATLIYTSGTTGQPKGVELTQDCWVFEGEAIDALGILGINDLQYLWLPLAHSLGKVLEAAQLKVGFCSAVDGRIDKMVENLAVVRPTFVGGVPRIFEKVHNRVVQSGREHGGLKARIFDWAIDVGTRSSGQLQRGEGLPLALAAQRAVADRLVFSKIRDRFGGRLRFFISGSAPLAKEIATFFHGAGILILEGYGLTESSAANFVNLPHKFKFGTVGPPLPGIEVKIAPEDGEILLKGRGVMRGYHNLPEATAEVLTADRWLKTGDIGELDKDGFLRITDRKKDLIKTSGGKYVAPQFLEGKLKAICPYLSQVVVHGDNRKYITALVALDEETLRKWARDNGSAGTYSELTQDPRVKSLIQGYFDQINQELPSYETIKYFAILPNDLTQEAGELTASLKLKRKVVEKKYKPLLDGLYANRNGAE